MIYTLIFILNTLASPMLSEPTRVQQELTQKTKADIDVSGFWGGTISRDEGGGKRVSFEIEIILKQNGKEITGISIVKATDNGKTYSAKMSLTGKIKNNYLKYIENKILSSDSIPDAEWCIKKVELIYKTKNNAPVLEGIWEGITNSSRACIPGRILLERRPPRV